MDTCACVNTRTSTAQRRSTSARVDHAQPATCTVTDGRRQPYDLNSSIDSHLLFCIIALNISSIIFVQVLIFKYFSFVSVTDDRLGVLHSQLSYVDEGLLSRWSVYVVCNVSESVSSSLLIC